MNIYKDKALKYRQTINIYVYEYLRNPAGDGFYLSAYYTLKRAIEKIIEGCDNPQGIAIQAVLDVEAIKPKKDSHKKRT